MAKSMRPGGGGRFMKLEKKIEGEGKSAAVARKETAAIGRKKSGGKKMGDWAAAGRKRAAR